MHAANETTKHTAKRVSSFFLWGDGGVDFCIQVFSSCSQTVPQVPNVFPKGVPNSTSLYHISFAQSSSLRTFPSQGNR